MAESTYLVPSNGTFIGDPNKAPVPVVGPLVSILVPCCGMLEYTKLLDSLLHPLKADLVITEVRLDPPRPKVGEVFGATLHYRNIGGKPARNFYLRQEPGTLGEGGWEPASVWCT